jgi:hypothetical protein
LFHVNFKERNGHSELGLVWIFLDVVKYMVDAPRNDTRLEAELLGLASKNSMSFSTSCLAISHYYSVIAIKDVHDNWTS